MRVVTVFFLLFSVAACGAATNTVKAAAATDATKKDCAACAKMCTVAADAEKNPGAVDACKADCKKTCS